ncbi:MAG: metallophosphoesterase [Anaerolineae bacterium]|nr:metallophosphoesterase [Anaerolineae bacterium]
MMLAAVNALLFVFFLLMLWFAVRVWQIPQVNLQAHWHIVIALPGFLVLDWLLLALLPRLGLSFGPVGPPLAALTVVRWLMTVLLTSLWRWSRIPSSRAVQMALVVAWVLNATLSLCAFEALYIEPFRLTVTEMAVDGPAFLPDRPLRIVQLSDLHVERTTRRERDVLAEVAALNPDLIVLTGDYLNLSYLSDPVALSDARAFLAQLHAPYGVYAVTDSGVDLAASMRVIFEGQSITVLHDETVCLPFEGADLCLIGIQSHRSALERDRAALESLSAQLPSGAYNLLLYHTPDLAESLSGTGIDLYLAGHTHGGQIRLPFYGAVVTFSAYGKKYEMGRYALGDTLLYVSRGLGMEGSGAPRARFLCPPEIVVVDVGKDSGE